MISAVCHFHKEPHALPGFIEEAEKMFDEIVLVSSPPDGTPPDEETIEIAKKSGHKLKFDTISKGFGVLRTRCISFAKSDWVWIADADERMFAIVPMLECSGSGKFPDTLTPDVAVKQVGTINQRDLLRRELKKAESAGLAMCVSRRHWFDKPGEFAKPCQNWNTETDWQLRIVKNSPLVFYDPVAKMHEKLLCNNWTEPPFHRCNLTDGPFIDHFSLHFKSLSPDKNSNDAETYEQLEQECVKNMWLNHFPKA